MDKNVFVYRALFLFHTPYLSVQRTVHFGALSVFSIYAMAAGELQRRAGLCRTRKTRELPNPTIEMAISGSIVRDAVEGFGVVAWKLKTRRAKNKAIVRDCMYVALQLGGMEPAAAAIASPAFQPVFRHVCPF